jgi:hypothetical protein
VDLGIRFNNLYQLNMSTTCLIGSSPGCRGRAQAL